MSQCEAEGCERKRATRLGLCVMHYKRFMRNGTIERVLRNYEPGAVCKTEGCENTGALSKGLCNACRIRLARRGTTDRIIAKAGEGTYNSAGYKVLTVNGKREYEHRLIAAEKLGRPMLPEEVVHHIDGNPLNNHPDNLQVLSGQSEHIKLHAKERAK